MRIGERVRGAREAKGWRQYELAFKLGVHPGTIGHIECGRQQPKLELLVRMADLLELSLDELCGRAAK